MTVFMLVVLILIGSGEGTAPAAAVKIFPDRFSCEQMEGTLATQLENDKAILGYAFPIECKAVETGKKV